MGDKVHYNLKNVHYAKLTITDGVPSFAAPVAIPGAVSIALDAQGETKPFYADGIVYYQSTSNNGYEGDLEIALVPDSFRQDILGEDLDATDKVFVENSNVNGTAFALLFEFDGDVTGTKHVLYNCTSTRPGLNGKTAEDTKEPDTEKLKISAVPLADGKVKARTGSETTTAVRDAWYDTVWLPGAAA